jgi:arylsulfatase
MRTDSIKSSARKPNIIFILIDALRRGNLGCYGYDRQTSPNIDKFARTAVVFDSAFSCANVTDPCLTSIFSGLLPASHGIIGHGAEIKKEELESFEKKRIELLPEILKREGYRTIAVDWLGRWHKRGYDNYVGMEGIKKSIWKRMHAKKVPYDNAEFVTDEAIRLVRNTIKENRNQQIFLFMHYWDTHAPYDPPENYIRRFRRAGYNKGKIYAVDDCRCFQCAKYWKGETKAWNLGWLSEKALKEMDDIFARYDGEVFYADNNIGRLLRFLKKEGIYDDSIVIITADHGESLGEHNLYFTHCGLYDPTVRIPLIIKAKGLKRKRISALVQQTDLFPTLLELAGIRSSQAIDGKSLIPAIEKGAELHSHLELMHVRGERVGIRTKRHKYICNPRNGSEELYDLQKDPRELEDISAANKELCAEFKSIIEKKIRLMKRNEDNHKNMFLALALRKEVLKRKIAKTNAESAAADKELEEIYHTFVWKILCGIKGLIKG